MTRSISGTVGVLAALAVLVAGCDSSLSSSSAQPKTLEAATAAAQEKYDRGSAGDFAGEWMLFSKQVRDRLSQADYIKYADACYAKNSPKMTVTGVRMEGADKAIVRLELGGAMDSRTMVYEDGAWVQESADNWYDKPVDQIIADEKSQGRCVNAAATETSDATATAPQTAPVQAGADWKYLKTQYSDLLNRECDAKEYSTDLYAACVGLQNVDMESFYRDAQTLPMSKDRADLLGEVEDFQRDYAKWQDNTCGAGDTSDTIRNVECITLPLQMEWEHDIMVRIVNRNAGA